jgi:hypothetical protein
MARLTYTNNANGKRYIRIKVEFPNCTYCEFSKTGICSKPTSFPKCTTNTEEYEYAFKLK